MIILPDVPKLKSMLEEAIEKNTALLEKVIQTLNKVNKENT